MLHALVYMLVFSYITAEKDRGKVPREDVNIPYLIDSPATHHRQSLNGTLHSLCFWPACMLVACIYVLVLKKFAPLTRSGCFKTKENVV